MDDLEAEWHRPRPDFSNDGWRSWTLCDTSKARAPWAWIITKGDNKFHLDLWRGTWEPHAVFDTLEDAKSVGRIMARVVMQGGYK